MAETGSIADRDRFAGRPSGIRRTPAQVHGIGKLFDRHAMLCTNPKAPLVAGLGRVGGVTALGSPIGAGSVLNGLTGIALALFANWRGWPKDGPDLLPRWALAASPCGPPLSPSEPWLPQGIAVLEADQSRFMYRLNWCRQFFQQMVCIGGRSADR